MCPSCGMSKLILYNFQNPSIFIQFCVSGTTSCTVFFRILTFSDKRHFMKTRVRTATVRGHLFFSCAETSFCYCLSNNVVDVFRIRWKTLVKPSCSRLLALNQKSTPCSVTPLSAETVLTRSAFQGHS